MLSKPKPRRRFDDYDKIIGQILSLDGNMQCADCGESVTKSTGWASLNLGVVVCIKCAGVHRSLGTHISKIRSFQLDTGAWTHSSYKIFLAVGGNVNANQRVWEASLPSYWIQPKRDFSEAVREEFIRDKYDVKSFLPMDGMKINQCIRRMPLEVMQCTMDIRKGTSTKWHLAQWGVLHSRWFSRYAGPKKESAKLRIDLSNCRIEVDRRPKDSSEPYTFSIFEDKAVSSRRGRSTIVSKVTSPMEDSMSGSGKKTGAEMKADDGVDSVIITCRLTDYSLWSKWVHSLRMTVSYYRLYDTLYQVSTEPPMTIGREDIIRGGDARVLGYAKLGWNKKWWVALNGYMFYWAKDQTGHSVVSKAQGCFDLQLLDAMLDDDGERSGAKFALLLFYEDSTIPLKFQSGPEAVMFYTEIKNALQDTRGQFTVDFVDDPPILVGDATGPLDGGRIARSHTTGALLDHCFQFEEGREEVLQLLDAYCDRYGEDEFSEITISDTSSELNDELYYQMLTPGFESEGECTPKFGLPLTPVDGVPQASGSSNDGNVSDDGGTDAARRKLKHLPSVDQMGDADFGPKLPDSPIEKDKVECGGDFGGSGPARSGGLPQFGGGSKTTDVLITAGPKFAAMKSVEEIQAEMQAEMEEDIADAFEDAFAGFFDGMNDDDENPLAGSGTEDDGSAHAHVSDESVGTSDGFDDLDKAAAVDLDFEEKAEVVKALKEDDEDDDDLEAVGNLPLPPPSPVQRPIGVSDARPPPVPPVPDEADEEFAGSGPPLPPPVPPVPARDGEDDDDDEDWDAPPLPFEAEEEEEDEVGKGTGAPPPLVPPVPVQKESQQWETPPLPMSPIPAQEEDVDYRKLHEAVDAKSGHPAPGVPPVVDSSEESSSDDEEHMARMQAMYAGDSPVPVETTVPKKKEFTTTPSPALAPVTAVGYLELGREKSSRTYQTATESEIPTLGPPLTESTVREPVIVRKEAPVGGSSDDDDELYDLPQLPSASALTPAKASRTSGLYHDSIVTEIEEKARSPRGPVLDKFKYCSTDTAEEIHRSDSSIRRPATFEATAVVRRSTRDDRHKAEEPPISGGAYAPAAAVPKPKSSGSGFPPPPPRAALVAAREHSQSQVTGAPVHGVPGHSGYGAAQRGGYGGVPVPGSSSHYSGAHGSHSHSHRSTPSPSPETGKPKKSAKAKASARFRARSPRQASAHSASEKPPVIVGRTGVHSSDRRSPPPAQKSPYYVAPQRGAVSPKKPSQVRAKARKKRSPKAFGTGGVIHTFTRERMETLERGPPGKELPFIPPGSSEAVKAPPRQQRSRRRGATRSRRKGMGPAAAELFGESEKKDAFGAEMVVSPRAGGRSAAIASIMAGPSGIAVGGTAIPSASGFDAIMAAKSRPLSVSEIVEETPPTGHRVEDLVMEDYSSSDSGFEEMDRAATSPQLVSAVPAFVGMGMEVESKKPTPPPLQMESGIVTRAATDLGAVESKGKRRKKRKKRKRGLKDKSVVFEIDEATGMKKKKKKMRVMRRPSMRPSKAILQFAVKGKGKVSCKGASKEARRNATPMQYRVVRRFQLDFGQQRRMVTPGIVAALSKDLERCGSVLEYSLRTPGFLKISIKSSTALPRRAGAWRNVMYTFTTRCGGELADAPDF